MSHRGVALLRPEHHWPSSSTVACSTTRMCPCIRQPLWAQTVTDVFVYELLRRLFHIGNFCFWIPFLKQLLLRNCAVDFVEICNVYVGKMIIKAAKRIFNCDKICRSYSDLNFGVTFFGTQCIICPNRFSFLSITTSHLHQMVVCCCIHIYISVYLFILFKHFVAYSR